jgi:hypothetical protein
MSDPVVISFGPGSLGLGLVKGPEHSPLKAMVQDLPAIDGKPGPAEQYNISVQKRGTGTGLLVPGMMLTHIDGNSVRNVPYQDIIKAIVSRPRTQANPLVLTFLDCGMAWALEQIKELQDRNRDAQSSSTPEPPPGSLTFLKAQVIRATGDNSPVSFSDQWLECLLARGAVRRGTDGARKYAVGKVEGVLKMHAQYRVPELLAQHDLNDTTLTPTFAREITCGSMYWYGYDRERRPILWIRPSLKHWKDMDVRKEVQAHILLLEHGLAHVLPACIGVSQVALVVETSGIDPVHHFAPCK